MADEARLAAALETDVHAVLRALRGSTVEEFQLDWGDTRIALKRVWAVASSGEGPAPASRDLAGLPLAAPGGAPPVEMVRAEMVGVFHRSREPDGPPLVALDEHVEPGRPLGVIDTLGMVTDVEATVSGRVVQLLDDGQPVEYGQVVAIITPE